MSETLSQSSVSSSKIFKTFIAKSNNPERAISCSGYSAIFCFVYSTLPDSPIEEILHLTKATAKEYVNDPNLPEELYQKAEEKFVDTKFYLYLHAILRTGGIDSYESFTELMKNESPISRTN